MNAASSALPSRSTALPRRNERIAARLLVAVGLGLAAAAFVWLTVRVGGPASVIDFEWYYRAAQQFSEGVDPYKATPLAGNPLYYPLPAILLVLPLSHLSLATAAAVFVGCSTALLAYGATADGFALIPLFFSGAFLYAVAMGQWSPLLAASTFITPIAWIVVAKPNIGLALFAFRPTRWAAYGAPVVLLLSLAAMPGWPVEWLRNVSSAPQYAAPVVLPGGALMLLAALRWRRPEARLLLALAVIPHALIPYEGVPLMFAVCRTLRQALIMSICSYGALVLIALGGPYATLSSFFHVSQPAVLLFIYAPALALVLARREAGEPAAPFSAANAATLLRRALPRRSRR